VRPEPNSRLDKFRAVHPRMGDSLPGANYGFFVIPTGKTVLRVISSGSDGKPNEWEHVSVSLAERCPTWKEMERVRELFFSPEECVLQFSTPRSVKVNISKNCLHLWRQVGVTVPLPPVEYV